MKNLKVLFQKSILIFVVSFLAACGREDEIFEPSSLPYESLKLPKQSDHSTPPTALPVDKLDKPAKFRYLTLYDESLLNVIVVKISTDDRDLLNSLNEETVKFITLDKLLPKGATFEAANTKDLNLRKALQPIEIEVIETKLQSKVKFFGIKFIKTDLIKASNSYAFSYKSSNVRGVHAIGNYILKDLSRFAAHTSSCPDCEKIFLAPRYDVSRSMISFNHSRKTGITLQVKAKFSDDLIILW